MRKAIITAVIVATTTHVFAQSLGTHVETNQAKLADLQKQIQSRNYTCDHVLSAVYAEHGYANTQGHRVQCDTGTYWVSLLWPDAQRPLVMKYDEGR